MLLAFHLITTVQLQNGKVSWQCVVPDLTVFKSDRSQTWPDLETQIRPEQEPDPDVGTTRFSDHRTIRLMKLMASTTLSTAIKRQHSSFITL